LKSTLPRDKVQNCLRWRGAMPNQYAGTFRVVWAAILATNFCIHSHAARAEGVNFELLIESLKARANPARVHRPEAPPAVPGPGAFAPPARKLKPIEELTEYVQCLKETRCRFAPSKTGEEAALELGYSRLFASAYEEVRLRVKARQRDGKAGSDDVVPDFAAIAGEEQAIDKLLSAKEHHAAAIAYLRALQNGDVVFPGPQTLAPIPPVLIGELAKAYPDISLNADDPVFATIYRQTREFVVMRIKTAGEISAAEIIGEFRRLIIRPAATPDASTDAAAICDKRAEIGMLSALAQACPPLRLNRQLEASAREFSQQRAGLDCEERAMASIRSKLASDTPNNVKRLCELLQQRVREGKSSPFAIAE
jgi:hypothetical protein